MRKKMIAVCAGLVLVGSATGSFGQALSSDEQSFFDKHLGDVIKVEPRRVTDDAVVKVFASPFYDVKLTIHDGDSTQTQDVIVTRIGDRLVTATRPGSDADLSDFPKTINPNFKLKTDDDAKAVQAALDAISPIGPGDKAAEKFRHTGNQWVFVRGTFFKDEMAYVLTTDDSGTVTAARFTLKAP